MGSAARTHQSRAITAAAAGVLTLAAAFASLTGGPALALSEIQGESTQPPPDEATPPTDGQIEQQPLPPAQSQPGEAVPDKPAPDDGATPPAQPGEEAVPGDDGAPGTEESAPGESGAAGEEPDGPIPDILYDLSLLPEPVRAMHDKLIEACKSGDIEKLRPLLDPGEAGTQLSFGGVDGDPIAYLRSVSGDKEGQEILAILEEVLSAGYVRMDVGSPDELYVWPYFFAVPLAKLTPGQRVELFKIVTAGDYDDMKSYGSYIFYRVGITPDGHWSFFVAGD